MACQSAPFPPLAEQRFGVKTTCVWATRVSFFYLLVACAGLVRLWGSEVPLAKVEGTEGALKPLAFVLPRGAQRGKESWQVRGVALVRFSSACAVACRSLLLFGLRL
jgi:hypothetical protein